MAKAKLGAGIVWWQQWCEDPGTINTHYFGYVNPTLRVAIMMTYTK